MTKLLFGIILLFLMTQLAGVVIELTLMDMEAQLEELPSVHPKVTRLLKYKGVQWFDWREDLQEYGYWRNGKWYPAR